jgi:hypothetical protein
LGRYGLQVTEMFAGDSAHFGAGFELLSDAVMRLGVGRSEARKRGEVGLKVEPR